MELVIHKSTLESEFLGYCQVTIGKLFRWINISIYVYIKSANNTRIVLQTTYNVKNDLKIFPSIIKSNYILFRESRNNPLYHHISFSNLQAVGRNFTVKIFYRFSILLFFLFFFFFSFLFFPRVPFVTRCLARCLVSVSGDYGAENRI